MLSDLGQYLALLKKEREIIEINCPVDPHLEAAEIHRRVIEQQGPALLFKQIKGAAFPLVTNMFGTKKRINLAFGKKPEELIAQIAKMPHELFPLSWQKIWDMRSLFMDLSKIGIKKRDSKSKYIVEQNPALDRLPLLTTWEMDGGPFITLPLVYTEHPENHVSNLGIYRLQRYDQNTTGLHFQIGKGGGFHLHAAKNLSQKLPVNIIIGGPPALLLSAIAPLPENVPELLLASFMLGKNIELDTNPLAGLPVINSAEFVLVGYADPNESRLEGPFGDHYGYYSLKHDFPVFHCQGILRKENPIFTATVVGKPKQEDFFLGDYIQELLSPIFPIVMPSVIDIWSYGETGYHSLACAVVKQRYKRESMVSAFRILGEGQLSLTKFLLVVDKKIDIRNFETVLEYILERADFRSDLYVFSNLSMDTLDYTGSNLNEGSKGVLLGVGDPIRNLPSEFQHNLPQAVRNAVVFCRGCLIIDGPSFKDSPDFAEHMVTNPVFSDWPLLILSDNAQKCAAEFLWSVFTRFAPGSDIRAKGRDITHNHITYYSPIIIDARMKPSYPAELSCDEETKSLVDRRWNEYFPEGLK